MGSLTPRGILDAPLSRGMTLRSEIESLRAQREGHAIDIGFHKGRRSRKLTRARSWITLVTRKLLKSAVLSGALVIAACAGFSQAQEHASYGRWGFDETGIDPRVSPGDSFFSIAVDEDEKDPTHNTAHASQGGLGLPDRDYYLRDAFRDKKAKYRDYVARLLGMVGWADALERADEVVAIETRIAEASWSRAESRDLDKTYNPLSTAELGALAPDFPWSAWLAAADVGETRIIVVRQKSAFPKLAKIFAEAPLATLQAWKAFRIVDQTAPFLSARFVTARFEFRGAELVGQLEERQRWRRATQLVGSSLGEVVGKEYVARHFPPDSKATMEELVDQLKRAMRGRIENLSWMTLQTKAKALEKLDLFGVKIGYPDKWRDYTALRIDSADLLGNVRRATEFRWAYNVAKLDRPVDRQEWFTNPQVVNAY